MQNRYSFYLISEKFKILEADRYLAIVLSYLEKKETSNFYQQQFDLLMDNIDSEKLYNQICLRFKERKDFSYENCEVVIRNDIAETYEKMIIKTNLIYLEYTSSKSVFYDFLALYYPDLIAFNERNKELLPLRLVKPVNIG